jgi:ligand-binding sensor domain-containing protein
MISRDSVRIESSVFRVATRAICTLVLTTNAVFALNPELDISQYVHTSWRVRDGFWSSGLNAMAQTPDGYMWIGTDTGLFRFDGVRSVPWQAPPNQVLPSTMITALAAGRDGTLWIGTEKGLASWKNGRLGPYSDLAGGAGRRYGARSRVDRPSRCHWWCPTTARDSTLANFARQAVWDWS